MAAPNLDTIPYDILHQIASGLSCHDYVNLSRVNRHLNATLRDESIARRSTEVRNSKSSSRFVKLISLIVPHRLFKRSQTCSA